MYICTISVFEIINCSKILRFTKLNRYTTHALEHQQFEIHLQNQRVEYQCIIYSINLICPLLEILVIDWYTLVKVVQFACHTFITSYLCFYNTKRVVCGCNIIFDETVLWIFTLSRDWLYFYSNMHHAQAVF